MVEGKMQKDFYEECRFEFKRRGVLGKEKGKEMNKETLI